MLSKNTRYLWGSDVRKNVSNAFFIITNKYNCGMINNPNKPFLGLANPILIYFITLHFKLNSKTTFYFYPNSSLTHLHTDIMVGLL